MLSFFEWLEGTSVAVAVAEASWIFPTLEVLHVLGLALVVGSIAAFDLRTLGLAWPDRPLQTLVRDVLPWTWGGFAIALITGGLLFSSSATFYLENPAFLAKMGLMLLAGLNVLFFHLHPHHRRLAVEGHASLVLRTSASISLILWTGIVVLGRWIGFV
jgi:uncharacterized membrane protein